jgi:hypothetical protein
MRSPRLIRLVAGNALVNGVLHCQLEPQLADREQMSTSPTIFQPMIA